MKVSVFDNKMQLGNYQDSLILWAITISRDLTCKLVEGRNAMTQNFISNPKEWRPAASPTTTSGSLWWPWSRTGARSCRGGWGRSRRTALWSSRRSSNWWNRTKLRDDKHGLPQCYSINRRVCLPAKNVKQKECAKSELNPANLSTLTGLFTQLFISLFIIFCWMILEVYRSCQADIVTSYCPCSPFQLAEENATK